MVRFDGQGVIIISKKGDRLTSHREIDGVSS